MSIRKIINFLKSANSEIVISTYQFNNKQVADVVKKMASKGVKVKIMVCEKIFKNVKMYLEE